MLEIKIDLIPFGQERRRKTLHIGHIVNDGSGDPKNGNYKTILWHKGPKKDSVTCSQALHGREPARSKIWKEGEIVGFKRSQKNAWYLLYLALKNIFED